MKKFFLMFILLFLNIWGKDIGFKIYSGIQQGDWRFRNPDKLNEFDGKNSFSKEVYSLLAEIDTKVYNHMYVSAGIAYENGFVLNNNSGSYDIIPFFLGGRIEYFQSAIWNPYIIGRIGYPIFINKKTINLDTSDRNGWASLSAGVTYSKKFLLEFGYKQHITHASVENKEFDGRFISLNLGYRFK